MGHWIFCFSMLNVSVKIVGDTFKGFFLQARDANTNEWIGSFSKTENTVAHSECSAITHADPRDKQQATLIWNAPLNARGHVYFTWVVYTYQNHYSLVYHPVLLQQIFHFSFPLRLKNKITNVDMNLITKLSELQFV